MTAKAAQLVPRNTALLVCCWLLTAVLFSAASLAWISIPQFLSVFASFGADLPVLTLVVIALRPAWWLLPVPALLLAVLMSARNEFLQGHQTRLALLAGGWLGVSLILAAAGIYAMYAPIFAMGQIH